MTARAPTRGWRRRWSLPAALAFLVFAAAGMARAAPAGTVVGLSGQCFLEHGGARTPLALGQSVEVADTVDVPDGGKLKLRMEDGSVVSLAAGSRMAISAYAVNAGGQRQDAQLSLGQGLLRAVVTPVEPPARFEVDTAVGTAAVRSTDWFVEASATTMRVRVLSGSVQMTSAATRRSVTIPARSGAHLDKGRDPSPPRVLRRSELNALVGRTRVGRDARHNGAVRPERSAAPHRERTAAPRRERPPAPHERSAPKTPVHGAPKKPEHGAGPEPPGGGPAPPERPGGGKDGGPHNR